MKIVFTGGGTGGHIYPALSIAEKIRERQPETEMLYIGGTRGIERTIIGDAGIPIKTIPVKGMPRCVSPALVPFAFNLGVSIVKSFMIIRGFKPSVIMATGGYVSGPPVLAARSAGVPVMMQEQNSYPGITTRKLAPYAETVFLGFADAAKYFSGNIKTVVTGNPVRGDIDTGNREEAAQKFGFDPVRRTVLVFGGSQGARAINRAVSMIVHDLAGDGVQVIWQTGKNEYNDWRGLEKPGAVCIKPYIDNMRDAYAAADLVVSRAGAMTIAEVTVCGLPAIFVPFPTAAENHQEYNASSVVNAGAASMILECDLKDNVLLTRIRDIILSDERLHAMSQASQRLGKKDAASIIANVIIKQFGIN